MKWGRTWGRMKNALGNWIETYWGGELDEVPQAGGTVKIVKVRGRIMPCESCGRRVRCAMYQSFTRNRMRHGEYSQGTNILHECAIYIRDKIPGSIKQPQIHGRTSGKQPT